MKSKKLLLPLMLLIGAPQYSSAINWTSRNQQIAILAAAGIGITGTLYNWIGKIRAHSRLAHAEDNIKDLKNRKQSLQGALDHTTARYKDQAFLNESYTTAQEIISVYQDYADIIAQGLEKEETAQLLSAQLTEELLSTGNGTYNEKAISLLSATIKKHRQALEQMKKALDKANTTWSHSQDIPLLHAQTPLILKAISLGITTLKSLESLIGYVQADLYRMVYSDLFIFKEAQSLKQYLDDPQMLAPHLDKLVRGSSHLRNQYPHTTYLKNISRYISTLAKLNRQLLPKSELLPFQERTVNFISSTHRLLNALKTHIMASSEYKLETQQYNLQAEAKRKHNEILRLRQKEIDIREEEMRRQKEENSRLQDQLNNMEYQLRDMKWKLDDLNANVRAH